MEKKAMMWKTKGMNKDTTVSAFSSDFSFDNRNLRLSTNENNTLLSWVNEKGTLLLTLNIDTKPWKDTTDWQQEDNRCVHTMEGTPVGTAVLNHQLVVFTTEKVNNIQQDRIYVFKYADNNVLEGRLLYSGLLGFSTDYPLETLVSFEAEHIQKVYWTDNKNQPRLINIAAGTSKLALWNHVVDGEAVGHEGVIDTFFDFIPTFTVPTSVDISKNNSGGGTFAPGVIQYCFTYVNRYGQQSNVVWVSPLYYLAFKDRGASPEEKVVCSFTIDITGLDANFDYVRLYSIQRTSLNLDPLVKILEDIPITPNSSITYVDNGTTGATIDSFELLYAGGKEIKALTMVDKSNTLFLGNIEEGNKSVLPIQEYFLEHKPTITFDYTKTIKLDTTNKYYVHTNTLNNNLPEITTFKGKENYRFGFQLQKATGEWSEPIFLNDATNDKYPYNNVFRPYNHLVSARATLDLSNVPSINEYKRIRPLVVYPSISDRRVLCQGVLNPTVFNAEDRKDNSPYAQASWYFRPYVNKENVPSSILISIDDSFVYGREYLLNEEETLDESLPSYFIDNNLTIPCHLLVADVPDIACWDVINSKEFKVLYVNEQGQNSTRTETFDCAIRINGISNTISGYTKCVFIRFNSLWNSNSNYYMDAPTPDSNWGTYIYVKGGNIGLQNVHILNNKTLWSTSNTSVSGGLLFYNHRDYENNIVGAPELVTFYFNYTTSSRTHYFEVVFNTVDITNYNNIGEGNGSQIAFNHYDSLYTFKDAWDETGGKRDPAEETDLATLAIPLTGKFKGVEIQNSIKTYNNPFSTGEISGVKRSNTQFFVDQSIVTLNSPDIEFDTDVQTWGTDGLALRVIGVVPITANVSSHSISTSSSMLEAHFNVAYDYAEQEPQSNESSEVTTVWDDWEHREPTSFTNTKFGQGETHFNVQNGNISYHAGNRLVADLLWHDTLLVKTDYYKVADKYLDDNVHAAGKGLRYFMVYPWHKTGALNNDWRVRGESSSWLDFKKEANALFSINTEYIWNENYPTAFPNIHAKIHLTENGNIINYKLDKQSSTSSTINYYPNIDKLLYNEKENYIIHDISDEDDSETIEDVVYRMIEYEKMQQASPISMKYKSTSHAVIALQSEPTDNKIPILPYKQSNSNPLIGVGAYDIGTNKGATFWGDTVEFKQQPIDMHETTSKYFDFLWLGELYKEPTNPFGGNSLAAIRNNKWQIGGDTVDINGNSVTLEWTYGDTYFQRYDCLKTIAYEQEDANQIVEMLSFMCETHVNIDGRYDKNRGQLKNYNMRPDLFNLWNPVYSQQDNFFLYQQLEHDENESNRYPNQITYSKTKTSGADVDLWTNITLASTLELDGNKGAISKLVRFNDQIINFQDSGISQLMYNENMQISTSQGVPIEIANSGKVQGARYFTGNIGCSNKWSVVSTPSGIYFIDSNNKDVYLFNGQFTNVSTKGGMNVWAKNNINTDTWIPEDSSGFVSYYDKLNQDILFINNSQCLAYSEKIGAFTSFYDYNNAPYFCNLDDIGIWISKKNDDTNSKYGLWKHQAGEYCKFFNKDYPYSITLIGNSEPHRDKTFGNLEFRACVDGDDNGDGSFGKFYLPFDKVETWNEYQHGIANLDIRNTRQGAMHHIPSIDNMASLKRDFRIWRCDIPRDNAPVPVNNTEEAKMHIKRFSPKPLNRMRNPWVYLKLIKESDTNHRTEIHDIIMTYFM